MKQPDSTTAIVAASTTASAPLIGARPLVGIDALCTASPPPL